jgi:hypothetical protein
MNEYECAIHESISRSVSDSHRPTIGDGKRRPPDGSGEFRRSIRMESE